MGKEYIQTSSRVFSRSLLPKQQDNGRILEFWIRTEVCHGFSVSNNRHMERKIPLYALEYVNGKPLYKWRFKTLKNFF